MKLFGKTTKLIQKRKHRENVRSIKLVEVLFSR